MTLCLDTCALLWHLFEPEKLSPKASQAIEKSKELRISSISIWEIGIKLKNKSLTLPLKLEEFSELCHQASNLTIIPIDDKLWIQSLQLDWKHKDPADRLIVALAKSSQASLVTSDKTIRSFYKKCVW